jgi:hypothetical protein
MCAELAFVPSMGSGLTAGIQRWRRVVGGFIAAIVISTYAHALSHGFWPSGHPWSGLTLSLAAVQSFLPLGSKHVAGVVLALGMAASAVLWGLSVHSASPERSRSEEASVSQESAADEEPSEESVAGAVGEAAATALGEAARLAASCRPKAGPAGPGKVRVVFSQDGSVQSVDLLTKKFRDTLTGSCVRMVFRRAKIPPFSEPSPTFIKSFSIPEE